MNNSWLPDGLGKYVYLASLSIGSIPQQKLAQQISSELIFKNDLSNSNTDFYEKISSALKALQKIADNEENKEKKAIDNYKQKIIKYLNDKNTPQLLKNSLQEQLNQLDNFQNDNITQEISFIKNINILEQNINIFKRRLNELHNLPENSQEIFNRLEYKLETDVDGFLRDWASRSRKSSQKNKIIKEMLQPLINQELKGKFNEIPGLEQALYSLLYIDFSEKLQNDENISISELNSNNLIDKLDKYVKINQKTNEASHLNQLFQNNTEESIHLAQDLMSFLGVEFISETTFKHLKEIQKQISQIRHGKLSETEKKEAIKKILGTRTEKEIRERILTYNDQIKQHDKKRFTFTFKTQQSHGFLQEIVRAIQKNGIDVSRNVATDIIIPLGICSFSQNEKEEQKELLTVSRDINNILSENFDKNQQNPITIENFNEAIKEEQKMNQQIGEALNKSSKNIEAIKNDFKESFISYESLKLYRSYETQTMRGDEFHGRKIQVLSALTKLYAAPGLAETLMEPDMLITFLLNIGDATLGSKNKNTLETYLSLFAGILMFDDISYMASEALTDLTNELPINTSSSIKQLHVYNINGVFLPLSVILNNLIFQIQQALQNFSSLAIDTNKTAKASLQPPKNISPKGHSKQDWENLSQSTIQNTQIQIAFLSGFTNYVAQLFEAMNPQ